jgi:hypothetical protein
MSPLSSQEDLLQRKAAEHAEVARRRQREADEINGLAESCARYWELLEEFVIRAGEVGVQPRRHQLVSARGSASRIEWVDGFRLTSGSVVASPPLEYCVQERRRLSRPKTHTHQVEEISFFVFSIDAGLSAGLSEPKTPSSEGWPPIERWDRAANVLLALEAELEASLLVLMDAGQPR